MSSPPLSSRFSSSSSPSAPLGTGLVLLSSDGSLADAPPDFFPSTLDSFPSSPESRSHSIALASSSAVPLTHSLSFSLPLFPSPVASAPVESSSSAAAEFKESTDEKAPINEPAEDQIDDSAPDANTRRVPACLWLEPPEDATFITHFITYCKGEDPEKNYTIRMVEIRSASLPTKFYVSVLSLFVSSSNVSKKTADLQLISPKHKIETYCLGDRSDIQKVGQKQVLLTANGLYTILRESTIRNDRDKDKDAIKKMHCKWLEELILPVMLKRMTIEELKMMEPMITVESLEHTLDLAKERMEKQRNREETENDNQEGKKNKKSKRKSSPKDKSNVKPEPESD